MALDKRVFLVVDDIEAMRKVITYQLRTIGADKIFTANNGAEALSVLKRHHVDVILSDWNMPVMSGLDLLKALRADAELSRIPFVMITAEAERARVEEAIANGVSNLLVKPYTTANLSDRIEKALLWKPHRTLGTTTPGRRAGPLSTLATASQEAAQDSVAAAERATILVVDDTPDNLQLLSEIFMDEYRVRVADNGQRALDICCSDTPPDLVLLDIMMPDMDGFEVARRMREHPNAETIPVIFVTALTTVDAQMKGATLGAVDFVTKPIDPNLLKPRVRNFMRYVVLHKQLQAEYDSMLLLSQLHEDVDLITRHDVKAPLAGIMALVQPLMDEGLKPDQVERLRLIEEMALQALNLVNVTTELYKIESGRFELNAQPVPIGDIVRRVITMMRESFAVKRQLWEVDLGPTAGKGVQSWGDTVFCYSILQNLLKNACEAAPDGSRIRVQLRDEDPLTICIRNTGAVPEAIREKFFEKFVTAGKAGGTGMGTYSAKLLTEAQGGTIQLEVSDAENSTELTVRLPRIAA